jgi:hypothetical protein
METVWQNRTVKERAGKYIAGKGGGDTRRKGQDRRNKEKGERKKHEKVG